MYSQFEMLHMPPDETSKSDIENLHTRVVYQPPPFEVIKRKYLRITAMKPCTENIKPFKGCSTRFTPEQESALQCVFYSNVKPSKFEKFKLAKSTGLTRSQVNRWFVNRRYRFKKGTLIAG